jgi:four helix bundle protein
MIDQIPNQKPQITNNTELEKIPITKVYDLEERTYLFAKRCRDFVKKLPRNISNIEYGKQLIRSSGSQAANYIEANEALGKKDFAYRIRVCRKEEKETTLWLKLCENENTQEVIQEKEKLVQESLELRKIFTTILNKSS